MSRTPSLHGASATTFKTVSSCKETKPSFSTEPTRSIKPTPDLNPNVQWTLEIVPSHAERVAVFEGPVRVGLAGPASLKTLLKYAKICGVTAATEVLKKQGFSLGRLLVANDPAKFVTKAGGTQTFHLYPFGGLEKCADWLRSRTHPDGTNARTGKHSPLKT